MLEDMPRISKGKLNTTTSAEVGEFEPTIVTADGVDGFVVMGLEEFVRMIPFQQGGEMCRIQGKMFREVL